MELARVGKPAPDFELTAFIGEGFKSVRLSDYKENGSFSVSIPVISPLSDRLN